MKKQPLYMSVKEPSILKLSLGIAMGRSGDGFYISVLIPDFHILICYPTHTQLE